MSYTVQEIIARTERMRAEWQNNAHMIVHGRRDEAVVYEGYATGLSYHNYEAMWSFIKVGVVLIIEPNPTNKYDDQATGLWLDGRLIGWVPKALNGPVSYAWKNKLSLECVVTDHTPTRDYAQKLSIKIIARAASNTARTYDGNAEQSIADKADQIVYNHLKGNAVTTKSVNQIVEQNISLGTSAAFLEAGRIANNQLSQIASKKLPIMVRAYADTAVGRLLLANIALMAKDHFRPNDERLGKLVNAMTVSAYQEVLQTFDVEQMIDDMISNSTIKRALSKFDSDSETVEPAPKRGAKAE